MGCQLELKHIIKDYGHFRAVDDISLQVAKGEILTLLGSSGCGKTTTLRMIAGLIVPTAGTIAIAGEDITSMPPYKRDIAMVFQHYALFPHMNVFENVVFGLRNRKIKDMAVLKRKAQEVLAIVQMEDAASKFPKQLSGGQQQRISLARALAVNPQVMLFDEPLSNLDEKLRESTRGEIRDLLKRLGITAIYVTHDQEEALVISDRIAVMSKGRIEQISRPRELYDLPVTRFVAEFVGQANLFEGAVTEVRDQTVTLRTATDLTIVCDAGAGKSWHVGDRATALVRPEHIRLAPLFAAAVPASNSGEGIVVAKSFLGSTVRYTVQLDGGEKLELNLHPDDDLHTLGQERIRVSWKPDRVIMLS